MVHTPASKSGILIAPLALLFGASLLFAAGGEPQVREKTFVETLEGKTRSERIALKSAAFEKVGNIAKTSTARYSGIEVEIVDLAKIEGGIQVFARGWKHGQPLGFGDGSVEYERFRIMNPPVLVPDPAGEVERISWNDIQGTTTQRFRFDTREALIQEVARAMDRTGKTGTMIRAGKRGSTVTVFRPDPNPESTSVDGYAFQANTASWATNRAAAGNFVDDSGTSLITQTEAAGSGNNWQGMRHSLTYFDTSSLPDTDTVSAAALDFYITGSGDTFGDSVGIFQVTGPSSNTAINTSDYDTGTFDLTTRDATDRTFAGLTTSAYNTWTLNAAGITDVSKTALSYFAAINVDWADNTEPSWVSGGSSYFVAASADTSGTTQDPTLTVTHAAAGGGGSPAPKQSVWDDDV